ncbi:MAG TPA: DinB family protein, partial [Burkholderiales bacterium]|nr:DinB family protein [Burkholderiales bacterium]
MLVDPGLDAAALARDLMASRARSARVTAGLGGARLLGPRLAIVNPPLWEIGHVAWFQERWCLRTRLEGELADSMLEGADALYDSSAVPHDARWDLPLPGLAATRAYAQSVLEAVLERLGRAPEDAALRYFVRLA